MSEKSSSSDSSLGKVMEWVGKLLVVIVFLVIILFVYQLYAQGGIGGLIESEAKETVGETKAGAKATDIFSDIADFLFDPDAQMINYGFESDVEEYEYIEEIGVEVDEWEHIGVVFENEPIELIGSLHASGIEEELELRAFCNLEDASGSLPKEVFIPAYLSSTFSSPDGMTAKFFKDYQEPIEVECTFPEGMQAETAVHARQATLRVEYEFSTRASHATYFMPRYLLDSLIQGKIDPFEFAGVSDSQLTSDNRIVSKTTPGPLNIGIGTANSQPFKEGKSYSFTVSLNKVAGEGTLKYLDYLQLKVPFFMFLSTDPQYQSAKKDLDAQMCDFEPTGDVDEYGFKIYELKDDIMQKINTNCDDQSYIGAVLGTSKEDCYDLYKKNIDARCKFMVPGFPAEVDGEEIFKAYIKAEARYIHMLERSTTVIVQKLADKSLSTPGQDKGFIDQLIS